MYGYFISEKLGIDYDKLNILKNNKEQKNKIPFFVDANEKDSDDIENVDLVVNNLKPVEYDMYNLDKNVYIDPRVMHVVGEKVIKENDDAYKGKGLVLLTESGTYTLFGWASKTYQIRGLNIKEMINRGVHTSTEWYNILFQLMAGLYTMQINNIYIENFSLESNVLVKDIQTRGQVTNYWKYKIEGIDYYVPNLGYVVLIDSNFRDLVHEKSESTFGVSTNTKKLNGHIFDKNIKNEDMLEKTFDMFKKCFNVNNFSNSFIEEGGCPPPDDIKDLLNKIMSEYSQAGATKKYRILYYEQHV